MENKITRRRLREELFKIIFSLEFHEDIRIKQDIEEIPDETKMEIYNIMDNYIAKNDLSEESDYIKKVIDIYIKNRKEILRGISENILDTWSLERISKASLSLIELAIIEIVYLGLDYKIAINEAVELSKKYQDEKETKFVNGVLKNFADKD